MSENNKKESRLPPPAFPPGTRRHVGRNAAKSAATRPAESAEDAFISPDDPIPPRGDPFGSAFISPDEPLPARKLELADSFRDGAAAVGSDEAEGQVVGMDLDPHLEEHEIVSGGDPHVMEVIQAVGKLAAALKRRGEAGLRASSEMSRFEATLRAYCVGYLAGRRAEEPPPPEIDEALPTDG